VNSSCSVPIIDSRNFNLRVKLVLSSCDGNDIVILGRIGFR
jgi:hypothetical protein